MARGPGGDSPGTRGRVTWGPGGELPGELPGEWPGDQGESGPGTRGRVHGLGTRPGGE